MESAIIEIVAADPGILATEIAHEIGADDNRNKARLYGCLNRMALRGDLNRVEHVARIEGRGIEFYRVGYSVP